MPNYEYECKTCDNQFTFESSIAEHERKQRRGELYCPRCGSDDIIHRIQSVFVTTSKKS